MKLVLSAIVVGLLIGAQSSFAARTPRPNYSSGTPTAVVQPISEIRAQKEKRPDFDRDLESLAGLERNYARMAPLRVKRISAPLQRIERQRYVPSTRKQSQVKSRAHRG